MSLTLQIVSLVVVFVVTFTTTWLSLHWWQRRTQRLITRMQSEAWRAWTDEWSDEK